MSEFPKIHIDTVANGDYLHLRTDTGDELLEVVEGLSKVYGDVAEKLGDIKQAALTRGVFSGDASAGTPKAGAQKSATASSSGPSSAPPECDHGPMRDMAGKRNKNGEPYKNRFYCTKWGSKCEGRGEWVES